MLYRKMRSNLSLSHSRKTKIKKSENCKNWVCHFLLKLFYTTGIKQFFVTFMIILYFWVHFIMKNIFTISVFFLFYELNKYILIDGIHN